MVVYRCPCRHRRPSLGLGISWSLWGTWSYAATYCTARGFLLLGFPTARSRGLGNNANFSTLHHVVNTRRESFFVVFNISSRRSRKQR
ncbi:hypothetical protein F4781DRAFT_392057 [Annulohypoxylon bovei var. microspora]|nr:hypothetical protein F4781DRAFT_392057 [Annulohypoxylon bovei var. microspora]